jgi:anti-sigma B factor antagonist
VKTDASERELQDGTLTLRVTEDRSRVTVKLLGELDMANAPTLETALEQVEAEPRPMRIDLSELEFIDSTGIALLVAAHHRLEGSDRLRLVPSRSSGVRRVLSLTGLDTELPFLSQNGEAAP